VNHRIKIKKKREGKKIPYKYMVSLKAEMSGISRNE